MNYLISLSAPENSGKTKTLRFLIELIQDSEKFTPIENFSSKEAADDFFIGKYGDIMVGCITFGDPGTEERIDTCLKECDRLGCRVIFAASRTYGKVHSILVNYCTNKENFQFVTTRPLYGRSANNNVVEQLDSLGGKMLFNLLNNLI